MRRVRQTENYSLQVVRSNQHKAKKEDFKLSQFHEKGYRMLVVLTDEQYLYLHHNWDKFDEIIMYKKTVMFVSKNTSYNLVIRQGNRADVMD